jgi:acetyl esterase/lipase
VHLPEKPNGAAIVICPGGGYGGLVVGGEGHGIAQWLNAQGIAGIVLEYRLPAGHDQVPLLDAQKALTLTRAHAAEWKIDPKKVGIIGFSAGGHLASTSATHFTPENRPDFAILIYPVITMSVGTHGGSKKNLLGPTPTEELANLYSNEKQVTKDTPPTFLAHALDDKTVPIENSRLFHQACQAKGVPSKLLELPKGGHGLNGYKGPSWDAWQQQSLVWLRELKFIP